VRRASIVVALLAFAHTGTSQSPAPEPPLADHCECADGICPLRSNGRGCSCGCAFTADAQTLQSLKAAAAEECRNGSAAGYPCHDVDLLAFLPLADIGGGSGNDIWGWTDPETGREYAIVGRSNGTAFVDITDPTRPRYLGTLPTHTVDSSWRDMEVYGDHAFIVSEAANHGMQVFDLRQLATVVDPPVTFEATAHYAGFGSAHTVAVDAGAGFAYAAGTRTCAGGLHAVNVQNPKQPATAGCYPADGYTHDAQCVVYNGPDRAHEGREVCFNSNEDTLTIVDASDKHAQTEISRTGYDASAYTHQGWLTDDRRFFLVDDEGDERAFRTRTRTFVWNVSDLEAPFIAHVYEGPVESIDHQLFTRGDLAYESNYRSGLRVLALGDLAAAPPREAGFFDIYPADDAPQFNGAWSVFPFFASGNVIVNGIEQGLFVLRPRRAPAGIPRGVSVSLVATNRPAVVGSDLAYVARVANHGPGRAQAVQLTVQLPASAAVMSTTPSRGSCAVSTIVTCSLQDIAAGADAVVPIRVRPGATGDIVAAARITADSVADDPADNAATAVVSAEAARRELVLRYPNGGETVRPARASAIQFTMRGVEGGVKVELSVDDGRTWTTLAASAPNVGFYDWVPPAGVQSLARVRVTSLTDSRLTATSAGSFAIR
jgi:choice-of-anchor B domain-containing protein